MGCAEKVVLACSGRVDTSVCIAEFRADEEIDWMTQAIAYTPNDPKSFEVGLNQGIFTRINSTPSTSLWR
ncbi:MAG: hypothetical protein F6K28_31475 [Microcoleus sp. SIO2G3]|nr:hypothetical protein [Microcoleus sp. SIO2G3]